MTTMPMRASAAAIVQLTMRYFRGKIPADQLEFLEVAMQLYGDQRVT